MTKANGTVRKVYEMETGQLPFFVQPQAFLDILTRIGR
jgi:hypothetical protein